MKLSFNLSAADLNTIIFALGILPELELEDTPEQADINQLCCMSAVHKITSGNTKLTANEFRVISGAIQALYLIIHGELEVEPKTKAECSRYVFDVNRMMPMFDFDFDESSEE